MSLCRNLALTVAKLKKSVLSFKINSKRFFMKIFIIHKRILVNQSRKVFLLCFFVQKIGYLYIKLKKNKFLGEKKSKLTSVYILKGKF